MDPDALRKLVFASVDPALCSMLRVWPRTSDDDDDPPADVCGFTLPPQTLTIPTHRPDKAHSGLDPDLVAAYRASVMRAQHRGAMQQPSPQTVKQSESDAAYLVFNDQVPVACL